MKKLIFTLFAAAFLTANSANAKNIVLGTNNNVVLKGKISNKTVNKAIYEISTHPSKALYLYINSPGGSILAGNTLVSYLKTTPKSVYCIADFAASMAFTILQHCKKRYVMSNSVTMQHEASIGLQNSVPQFLSLLKMILTMINTTEKETAGKIGITYKKYKKKTRSDWWLYGKDSVREGVADKLVTVLCTKKLTKTLHKETIRSFFSSAEVEWSGCPLLTYPITVNGNKKILRNNGVVENNYWNSSTIKEINRYTVNEL